MKKILTIGDIHGRDIWKKLTLDTFDKIIFTGDYVDSFDISDEEMINNLLDIIEFKKSDKENIILLIGNHELNYFPKYGYKQYGASGFRVQISSTLKDIFSKNIDLFQYAHQISENDVDYLWTHGGVTNRWYKDVFTPVLDNKNFVTTDSLNIADQLNMVFSDKDECMTQVGWERGGYHKHGSPLWVDKAEFLSRGIPLRDCYQIVGHNPVKDIEIHYTDNSTKIVFTDCLANKDRGYILNI